MSKRVLMMVAGLLLIYGSLAVAMWRLNADEKFGFLVGALWLYMLDSVREFVHKGR